MWGHGLGDIVLLFPIWIITAIFFLMFLFKKHLLYAKTPAIILGIILSVCLYFIIFDHGPECRCALFDF
jgi:hypothetical protein